MFLHVMWHLVFLENATSCLVTVVCMHRFYASTNIIVPVSIQCALGHNIKVANKSIQNVVKIKYLEITCK